MDNPPPTLARGLARSLYNDVERLLDKSTERLCSDVAKCKSKKRLYNSILNSFDKTYEALIVDKMVIKKTGKRAKCIYAVLAPDEITGRITMDLVQFTKYPTDVQSRRFPLMLHDIASSACSNDLTFSDSTFQLLHYDPSLTHQLTNRLEVSRKLVNLN